MKTKADLQGAVIGVQLGTTSDGLATELEKKGDGTKVERYNKGADAIQALLQGKIDCMVTDEAPAKAFQRVNSKSCPKPSMHPLSPSAWRRIMAS